MKIWSFTENEGNDLEGIFRISLGSKWVNSYMAEEIHWMQNETNAAIHGTKIDKKKDLKDILCQEKSEYIKENTPIL